MSGKLDGLLALQEQGIRVPSLERMPSLDVMVDTFWRAFMILSGQRQTAGEQIQPIQLSEIKAYADLHLITDEDDLNDLVDFVCKMDRVFLDDHNKNKAKQKRKQAKRQNTRR